MLKISSISSCQIIYLQDLVGRSIFRCCRISKSSMDVIPLSTGVALADGIFYTLRSGGVHPIAMLYYFQIRLLNGSIIYIVIVRLAHIKLYMKNNQKVLELHSHLSKLLDSLAFQLAVNIPDENSLSLLQIISMRKNDEINHEQFRQLYKGWLESKNIFDIFTAKQVKIFPKGELISIKEIADHLNPTNINKALELLNELYNDFYLSRKANVLQRKHIQEIENIFSYLDGEGVIHLRPSQLFFLTGAILICQNYSIPLQYDTFKVHFKQMNKQMCEIDGLVSLRWFKNYILGHNQKNFILKNLMSIFKQMEKLIAYKYKGQKEGLPNIIDEALSKWKNSSRFTGVFELKKKKVQIYKRIFDENEQIFFFNGKDDNTLSEVYFINKYGEQYVKCLEIDNHLLKQFSEIVKNILNDYVNVMIKVSNNFQAKTAKLNGVGNHYLHALITPVNSLYSNKKKNVSEYQNKQPLKLQIKTSGKEKTPQKRNKGNESKRNVTPTHKRTSPFMHRQFGSTEKSISKNKYARELTPTKSYQGGYHSSIIGGHSIQVYRGSKKQGLQKDSFYEKLFFFRNKRVQSFDIVMKRLKGK